MAHGGVEATTTRSVAVAAGVQVPTIYRLFGDKRGLLDAVAEAELAAYVAGKVDRPAAVDPVDDLHRSWDDHIAFCLANPGIFALMSGAGASSPAARAGLAVLRERVRRVAATGALQVGEERAVDLIHAAGTGTVLLLLDRPDSERVAVANAARDAVMAAVLSNTVHVERAPAAMASGLRAHLPNLPMLTPGERHLLDELLRRIADA